MAVPVKIVVGVTMAVVVLVVAAVTLAITYSVSIAAIRTSGQRLAASMVDTALSRSSNYMNTAENAMYDIVAMTTISGYMLPVDDPNPRWYDKWALPLRTHFADAKYDYSNIAIITNDGGLVVYGTWWVDETWIYGYALDPKTLAATGSSTLVDFSFRNKTSLRDFNPAVNKFTPFAPGSTSDQRIGGYKTLLALTGGKPVCFWVPPGVNTFSVATGDFVIYGSCALYNATNVLMGTISVGRRLAGIAKFLDGIATTPGTQVFVSDNQGLLVATTHSTPVVQYYAPGTAGIKVGVDGCVSSNDISPGPAERIGCRTPAAQSAYAPLRDIANSDPAFIKTLTRDERYGSLADAKYYYIATIIPTRNLIYWFNLLLFLPEEDVLGDIVTGTNTAIGVTVAVFVVAVVAMNVLLQLLLAPLDDVAQRMYRVANLQKSDREGLYAIDEDDAEFNNLNPGVKEEPVKPSSMTEIRALQVAYETMDTAIQSFTRYVPRDVVRELVATNQICEIAMRDTNCSMLFTDIANFTSICERVHPTQLSSLVKLYFERSSRIVMGHGGIIDKFIGDCIMAVWGAPVPIEKHELRAALCARMMVHEVDRDPLKKAFADVNESLAIRVGVASGQVLAGNMGSEMRMSYTVIGDEVNLAARLESLNKQWGTSNMIAASTALECQDWLVMRHVVTIAVVGKEEPVEVYEVIGVKPNANTEMLGAFTTEQSEMRSLSDVKRDREREELGQAYLTDATTGEKRLTVGRLMRRAMAKAPVTPELITWAEQYTAALTKYQKRDFAGALSILRAVASDASLPPGVGSCKSVVKLGAACEQHIKNPPPDDFNGVWKAEEK